ncbi:hypothetical protein EP331_07890 [bacterium]|nr:MAG: hypothetical protein EP331_07890 [bacterium]
MQFNAVNSAVLHPPVMTEAGTPIVGPNPIQSFTVSPTFNLPKDGQRPEDKHPKNKNPYQRTEAEIEVVEDQLPENFKLILSPDFHEIFKAFFETQGTTHLAETKRLFRLSNGMKENTTFSRMYQKMPDSKQKRQEATNMVMLYHTNRPGARFVGSM